MWVRNPIFDYLVQQKWPIYNHNHEYFIYYMAFWLPPAMAAKALGAEYAPGLLYLWSLAGVSLSIFLFFFAFRRRVLYFTLVFLFLGSVSDLIRLPWRMAEVGMSIGFLNGAFWQSLMPYGNIDSFNHAFPWYHQITWTFNHAIPLMALISTCFTKRLPFPIALFSSALLVSSSPFAALALLPYLAGRFFRFISHEGRGAWHMLACAILAVAPLLLADCLYFLSNPVSESRFMFFDMNGRLFPEERVIIMLVLYALFILNTAVALKLFCFAYRRTAAYRTVMLLAFLLPIVWIGKENNELFFKASAVIYALIAFMMIRGYPYLSKKRRIFMVVWILIAAIASCKDIGLVAAHYTWNENAMISNYQPPWEGMKPEQHRYYRRFWGPEPKSMFPDSWHHMEILKAG